MKLKIIAAALVTLLVISASAWAQQPASQANRPEIREMIKKRQMRMEHDRQGFLTEEQKASMQKMRLETAGKIRPLKNELRELEARQQTLSTSEKPDLPAIDKNIEKISQVKAEMAKIMARQRIEFRSMLTEEQLLKMELRNERIHKGRMGQPWNRPHRPGTGRGA